MKLKNNIMFFIVLIFTVLLYGCTKDLPPGTYETAEVGKLKKVVPGVIISKRPIFIYSKKPELSATENVTDDNIPVLNNSKRTRGYEYVIKLNNGDIISIAQDEDLKLKSKQRVLVIYGTTTRVVADEGSDEN